MGLLGKAAILAGGYYMYKHHQDKKRAQREGEHHRYTDQSAPVMNRDYQSQSQFSDYPRDSKPQQPIDYYSRTSSPAYEQKHENYNMSGAKY